ncbi:MAG: enoyl-CoA hydratase-related protein [Gammaproteobacteria bacterium]
MNDAVVLREVDARGVATVTLNRPAVNNAYDAALLEALLEGVLAIAADSSVRVVVVRGNGPHFQAGADLKWLRGVAARDTAENLAASRLTAEAMRALNQLPKPTLALVQGACVGGGTGLAASCDIVIAESSASFAISEARWGMAATIIFPQLVAAMGIRNVRRYALTCERFDAASAAALGLVHVVCEPGALDATAAPIIDSLLGVAPDAIALSKRSAMQVAGALVNDAAFERLVAEHAAKRQSAEAAEGLASFAEKRHGSWYPAS